MRPTIRAYYENSWICIDIIDTDCHEHSVITLSTDDATTLLNQLAKALGSGFTLHTTTADRDIPNAEDRSKDTP
jgi:hypothetical protein